MDFVVCPNGFEPPKSPSYLKYHPQAELIGRGEGCYPAKVEVGGEGGFEEQEKYGRARKNSPMLALRPRTGAVNLWTRLHYHGCRLPRPRANFCGRDHGPVTVLLRPARVVGVRVG